ncbi:MAG: hypothetical protein QOJ90_2029 [Actinomycetota bacterium]|nr:hypothetical protein [Actinomycetota bacterium]
MDQPARLTPPLSSAIPGVPAAAAVPRSGLLTGAGWVTAAMTAANLLGYALNLLASRRLGPSDFGVVAALLGVVVVANVAALAVQAVVARRVSSGESSHRVLGLAVRTAVVVGVVSLAAIPAMVLLLHLRTPAAAVWTVLVIAPLILIGAQLGVLQGREQFGRLSVGYVVAAAGKVGGGLVGLALVPSPSGVMAGTAIGAIVAWLGLIPLVTRPETSVPHDATGLSAGAEVLRAGQALFAFFLMTNLDLLVARHYLRAHEAGLYAVGAVVSKGAFWLPSAVPVLLLPKLVDRHRRAAGLRTGLLAVAAAGTIATGVCAAAGRLVIALVGGSAYDALAGTVWLFALCGSLFAVAQLLLYSRLARADHAASLVLWTVLGAYLLAVVVTRPDSPLELVLVAMSAAGALVAAGFAVEATRGARDGESA